MHARSQCYQADLGFEEQESGARSHREINCGEPAKCGSASKRERIYSTFTIHEDKQFYVALFNMNLSESEDIEHTSISLRMMLILNAEWLHALSIYMICFGLLWQIKWWF